MKFRCNRNVDSALYYYQDMIVSCVKYTPVNDIRVVRSVYASCLLEWRQDYRRTQSIESIKFWAAIGNLSLN